MISHHINTHQDQVIDSFWMSVIDRLCVCLGVIIWLQGNVFYFPLIFNNPENTCHNNDSAGNSRKNSSGNISSSRNISNCSSTVMNVEIVAVIVAVVVLAEIMSIIACF